MTRVLIIGGGISGLRIGSLLSKEDIDFKILESRERVGGRVLTHNQDNNYFDLGPTWFWPDTEKTITNLINELNISTIEQYNEGYSLLELSKQEIPKYVESKELNNKSKRIVGGINTLVNVLKDSVPSSNIELNKKVISVIKNNDATFSVNTYDEIKREHISYHADILILTLPPRLLLESISFTPSLPKSIQIDLLNKPTWMGAQAKIVVTFDKAFWRDKNLSGNVVSWAGPLREIYDASTEYDESALFGFFSLPPAIRNQYDNESINKQVIEQLIRLFGPEAKSYNNIFYKDWSQDNHTVTEGDKLNIESFPSYGSPPEYLENVIFSGTEYNEEHGGHLEGALVSAEKAYFKVKKLISYV
ncbi:flavin monoamine oxidase family protein [Staphylococcus xylosus]|uniref:flavin monoamine oxidase family protein n=1 Tax=Staphylococcus xylosus TaxID=1288 RepID=UPI002DB884CA|nr:FAD-dependent oxidoreductase [Staphylococcus xylosus]MEB8103793.1 FAD-dependent oxidoreductase [Staphylococcus xylosus]